MKKGLLGLGILALAIAIAVPSRAHAMQAEVRLAPMGRSFAPPSLGRKDGWLAISNRDWQPYTIVIERKGRASIYEGAQRYAGQQSFVIPSGATMTIALEKDSWEFRGNNDDKLKVKVREGRTSTLSLEPFGPVGNTGLRGISNDGDKVRSEILFDTYVAPIVVQRPPVIVQTPPPPPVIVTRPPVIVERPRPRPPYHRPPPPSHRPRPGRNDGWGFSFDFNSR